MVQIRVLGGRKAVEKTTDLLCRVATVSHVGNVESAKTGSAVHRTITATAVVDVDCLHPGADVALRGRPQQIGPLRYLVEYGVCTSCSARVVRVAAYAGEVVSSVSGWSEMPTPTQ